AWSVSAVTERQTSPARIRSASAPPARNAAPPSARDPVSRYATTRAAVITSPASLPPPWSGSAGASGSSPGSSSGSSSGGSASHRPWSSNGSRSGGSVRAGRSSRSGPAAEIRRGERAPALRACHSLGDALDHLERAVAVRAATVATVGARVRQVDDAHLLAGLAQGEPPPVARSPRLPPPDGELAGGVGAGGAAVLDERSHLSRSLQPTCSSCQSGPASRRPGTRGRSGARLDPVLADVLAVDPCQEPLDALDDEHRAHGG